MKELFSELHPGFFDREYIKSTPADEIFCEMLLPLQHFNPSCYSKELAKNITFGYYTGDLEHLRKIVAEVEPNWVKYFDGAAPIYCGYVDDEPVSFCLITDYGRHQVDDHDMRIGGPGCVGTLPQYRDQGIGLTMVKHVTELLRQQGYDLAYIHYTSEPAWYAKLGYPISLRWSPTGFLS